MAWGGPPLGPVSPKAISCACGVDLANGGAGKGGGATAENGTETGIETGGGEMGTGPGTAATGAEMSASGIGVHRLMTTEMLARTDGRCCHPPSPLWLAASDARGTSYMLVVSSVIASCSVPGFLLLLLDWDRLWHAGTVIGQASPD